MEQVGVHERRHSSMGERKKKRLVMLLYIFLNKKALSLLFSSHLCLVTRENRDKGILNMPLTPEL
jgi:hypothetical protein